ncbi:hypothetical protein RFI_22486 [Reticulomyxa filosa]|uniref:Uncharacterized protein n=1 Tax=Reticulomyxa filosa TaxID=46433 RepID=X6MLM8_RETFI|nr:hypothetical protein RFI_22486 [Reticulomyxa filosa]|eukprot:ETO14883.1 hypothetical protein RFI_22486 [Reticulomyxa filosa]
MINAYQNYEGVISLFMGAMLLNECRHNVALWRLFLSFLRYLFDIDMQYNTNERVLSMENNLTSDLANMNEYQKRQRRRKAALAERQDKNTVEIHVTRLKSMFDNAIANCAHNKLLWLHGWALLFDMFDEKEWNEWLLKFEDKELRLHQLCP